MNPDHLAILACPSCRASVVSDGPEGVRCSQCERKFPIVQGVLRMLPENTQMVGGWQESPGYGYGRFEAKGSSRRKNDRERAIVEWFLKQFPEGAWMLDVPCGMGRFSDLAHERGARLCSIDLVLEHTVAASKCVEAAEPLCVQGDITALPLQSDSMDAAICVRISHYFEDDALSEILKEVSRVAKDVLLSYRNSRTPVAWWRSLRMWVRRRDTGGKRYRSSARIMKIAESVGLTRVGKPPQSGALHLGQFIWLRRTPKIL